MLSENMMHKHKDNIFKGNVFWELYNVIYKVLSVPYAFLVLRLIKTSEKHPEATEHVSTRESSFVSHLHFVENEVPGRPVCRLYRHRNGVQQFCFLSYFFLQGSSHYFTSFVQHIAALRTEGNTFLSKLIFNISGFGLCVFSECCVFGVRTEIHKSNIQYCFYSFHNIMQIRLCFIDEF